MFTVAFASTTGNDWLMMRTWTLLPRETLGTADFYKWQAMLLMAILWQRVMLKVLQWNSQQSLHNVSTVARNWLPRGKCFITILDLCVCLALLLMFHSILAYTFCDVVSLNFSL